MREETLGIKVQRIVGRRENMELFPYTGAAFVECDKYRGKVCFSEKSQGRC